MLMVGTSAGLEGFMVGDGAHQQDECMTLLRCVVCTWS